MSESATGGGAAAAAAASASASAAAAAAGGGGGGGKKKGKGFGKNLNKLIKQQSPAPPLSPVTVGGAGANRGGGGARTGLLLLSTKKASAAASSAASAATSGKAGGAGVSGVGAVGAVGGVIGASLSLSLSSASASASAPPASSSASSTAAAAAASAASGGGFRLSAHDALLTAAAVEAGLLPPPSEGASPKQQDAWGVAEKQKAARTRGQPLQPAEAKLQAQAQAQARDLSLEALAPDLSPAHQRQQQHQQAPAPALALALQPVLKPRRGVSSSFPRAAPPPSQPQGSVAERPLLDVVGSRFAPSPGEGGPEARQRNSDGDGTKPTSPAPTTTTTPGGASAALGQPQLAGALAFTSASADSDRGAPERAPPSPMVDAQDIRRNVAAVGGRGIDRSSLAGAWSGFDPKPSSTGSSSSTGGSVTTTTAAAVGTPRLSGSGGGGGAGVAAGHDRDAQAIDEVRATMVRLARERAEKRRAEEEERMREQKERAARRLKELEEKLSSSSSSMAAKGGEKSKAAVAPTTTPAPSDAMLSSTTKVGDAATSDGWRQPLSGSQPSDRPSRSAGSRIAPVLERLGRTKQGSGSSGAKQGAKTSSDGAPSTALAAPSFRAGPANGGGRSLFDPNRPYSSLVGGTSDLSAPNASASSSVGGTRGADGRVDVLRLQRAAETALSSARGAAGAAGASGGSPRLSSFTEQRGAGSEGGGPPGLIHLSSYEDRDRGGRVSSSSGPRMLFDPKSGSMVAAPEGGGSAFAGGGKVGGGGRDGAGGGKKERRDKAKSGGGGRSSREGNLDGGGSGAVTLLARPMQSAPSAGLSTNGPFSGRRRSPSDADAGVSDESLDFNTTPSGGSRRRGRREDSVAQSQLSSSRKERSGGRRGGTDVATTPSRGGADGRDRSVSSSGGARGRVAAGARSGGTVTSFESVPASPRGTAAGHGRVLPRTCGVLYRRDGDGRFVCADGCDADQGYGAHSVPGGRARNPDEHVRFLERRRKLMRAADVMNGLSMQQQQAAVVAMRQSPPGFYNGGALFPPGFAASHVQMQFDKRGGLEARSSNKRDGPAVRQQHQLIQHQHLPASYGVYDGFDGVMNMHYFSSDVHEGNEDEDAMTGNYYERSELEPEVFTENYEIPLVKADETIELVIGGDDTDDSPTLQATAAAWAPSEAALAAAAAAIMGSGTAMTTSSLEDVDGEGPESLDEAAGNAFLNGSDDDLDFDVENVAATAAGLVIDDVDKYDDDDDEDHGMDGSPSFLGLGFDPTENMDSVMMSPAHGPQNATQPIDFVNLSLDAAQVVNSANPFASISSPGNPSQFLGSSTWGTGSALGASTSLGGLAPVSSLASWDILGGGNLARGTTEERDQNTTSKTDTKGGQKVASFLSLSALGENTWGAGGIIGGLGGFSSNPLGGAAQSGTKTHDKD